MNQLAKNVTESNLKALKSRKKQTGPRNGLLESSRSTKRSAVKNIRDVQTNTINLKKELSQKKKGQDFQKMQKYLEMKRTKFLKERLSEYYGRNFPVNYKQHYNFQEQWSQNLNKKQKYLDDYLNNENNIQISAAFFLIIVFTLSTWLSNVDHFFCSKEITMTYQIIFLIFMFIMASDGFFRAKYCLGRKQNLTLVTLLSFCYKQIFCILSFGLKITSISGGKSYWWIIQLISTYFLFFRISQLYQTIRFLKFRLYHTYQSKIIDLIITLLIILHIIAIVLFVSTKTGYPQSWIHQLQINVHLDNEYIIYLYSYYFASTTILTVGYGDIAPKNPVEVGVVILVQIFGIICFAYLINQIGYSISTLRKGREVVESDLSVIEKMRKHYNMDEKLVNEARAYLINHKPNPDLLEPNEECNILTKFNESLRNDITNSNKLAIVKSSIFFLTRWSQAFQRSIAKKLIHVLFSPYDAIYQPLGNERIYLIKTGKINVYAERNGRKKGCNNILKTISSSVDTEIADNCYGYTAVISTRPSRLYAYSKEFTSAYYIDKQTFYTYVSERPEDLEFYHQIHSRIDESKCWQSYEVPLLNSNRHHYNPTKTALIRKLNKRLQKLKNNRKEYKRNPNQYFRGRKHLSCGDSKKQIISKVSNIGSQIFDLIQDEEALDKMRVSLTSDQQSLVNFIISTDHIDDWNINFEQSRQYTNFFKMHNRENVLRKYQLEFTFGNKCDERMIKYREQLYKSTHKIRKLNLSKVVQIANKKIREPSLIPETGSQFADTLGEMVHKGQIQPQQFDGL